MVRSSRRSTSTVRSGSRMAKTCQGFKITLNYCVRGIERAGQG